MNSFGAATSNGVRNLWNCPVGKRPPEKRRITATPRWSNRSRAVITVDAVRTEVLTRWRFACSAHGLPFGRLGRLGCSFLKFDLVDPPLSVRRADMRTYFVNWSALSGTTVIFMLIERSAQLSQVVPLDAFAVSRDREVHSYLSIFIAFNKSETFRIKEEEKKNCTWK